MEKGCQNITLNSPFVYLYCNQTIKDMTKIKDSVTGRFICDHGMRWTTEYYIWRGLINRCYNPKTKHYARYGGRGIKVCDQWRHSFINFFNDVGYRPEGLSLDRKDNNGNYEPSNCRWATTTEQQNNTRANVLVTYNGETKSLTQWCKLFDVKRPTIAHRLDKGMSPEEAFTKPVLNCSAYKNGNGYRKKSLVLDYFIVHK